jgi:hypothetical protein
MSQEKMLKEMDRKLFTSYFEDGLVEIFLAFWAQMFVLGPYLSKYLGDFWSSFIFLPFWAVVYLILRYVRKKVVEPRIGSVKWGTMRKKKLRTWSWIMLVLNLIFLLVGVLSFVIPGTSGFAMALRFSTMMLILFSAAGYMLDFKYLYVYGILLALAIPAGEWLYQNAGFTHHGIPAVFGGLSLIILIRGIYKFITLVKNTPLQIEGETL